MSIPLLSAPVTVGQVKLTNRAVMAPMTRSRAEGNVPSPLAIEYYAQRASAGLIVTEGTSPSPNGLGYARIPGLFSWPQLEAWSAVTAAVHARGGHIAVQLMHTGRVGHPLNLPPGAEVLAPSAIAAPGTMYTDAEGMKPFPIPRAMTLDELRKAQQEFVSAGKNAVQAGFDFVELHAANGYLLEQFISPLTNQRQDEYGGSIERRIRFVLETAEALVAAIGGHRVGIRLSPFGVNAGMGQYVETYDTHCALVSGLAPLGLQYVHLVDHSSMGAPTVPEALKRELRALWPRTFILAGGFDHARAEDALAAGHADLIAFGRPFLANPDLLQRFERGLPLNAPDPTTFYTPGPRGYVDYPFAEAVRAANG